MTMTKEDIEKAKQYLSNEGYGTGSNFTVDAVANLMVEYKETYLSKRSANATAYNDGYAKGYEDASNDLKKFAKFLILTI
jgi:hypothetical protein